VKASFGARLQEIRTQRGLSQQQLAVKTNVSRSNIAHWESGRSLPDVLMLPRLASALRVDISELVMDTGKKSSDLSVILVDDERIVLAGGLPVLAETLPSANITGFLKPSEALEFAKRENVALAFVDIELGSNSGLTICRELLRINPLTNVIFLTSFPDYALEAWKTGASGFLLKPLEPEGIREQLATLRHPIGGFYGNA